MEAQPVNHYWTSLLLRSPNRVIITGHRMEALPGNHYWTSLLSRRPNRILITGRRFSQGGLIGYSLPDIAALKEAYREIITGYLYRQGGITG